MVYLLRHGEIAADAEGVFIGCSDIPLNTEGRSRAERWRSFFLRKDIHIHRIYASDLLRCRETADILSHHTPITFLKELREIDLGSWEGKSRHSIRDTFPAEWEKRGRDPGFRPPGGESFASLAERSLPVITAILKSRDENSIVVSHAGIIRSFIGHILQIPFHRIFTISLDYGGMTLIDNRIEEYRIRYINRTI